MEGALLNHYRITRALGSGGMGEVYEAEDTKLHRSVAVKVLPPSFANDPERRQRLQREARAVAALNHPNIVTVHSIEEAGDRVFLTMELVRGRTLTSLIPARGLPIADLLQLAVPIADAVGAAHQHGVVHRDLKPDNIMVADDGRLKILDFGLASLTPVAAVNMTTITGATLTSAGQVMGTGAYMSPEQAQGLEIDARSDIFSLGIVLFEMATGKRPFAGDTTISLLSSIVKDSPPSVATINPAQPIELARIVRRSLAKDRMRRYQTAVDVRNDLDDLRQQIESGAQLPVQPPRARARTREVVAWALATLLLVALLLTTMNPTPRESSSDIFSIVAPEKTTLTEGEAPQVSPNGATVAFVATDHSGRTRLYLRERDSFAARAIEGTEDAAQPFWSPDSRSIGFFAGGHLKRVSAAGGRPQTLAPAPVPRGGTWSRDDVIVYVPFPEQPPHRVAAAGGATTPLPVQKGTLRWMPSFLPDGRHYLFLAFGRGRLKDGIFVGSLDTPDVEHLVGSNTSASYIDSGHLVFRREASLVAQRFNVSSRQLEGTPVVLADSVAFNPITQQAMASASANGVLAYVATGRLWHLTWFDRNGRLLAQAGTIGGYNSLCLSADGSRVVYDLADPKTGNVDLWAMELSTATSTRLTFDDASDFYAACSSRTNDVIFASPRTSTPNLYKLALSAPGEETFLGDVPLPMLPSHWSHDGGRLVFSALSPTTDFDVWVIPATGGTPTPVAASDAAEKCGHLSRDGRWIAYASGKAGDDEIYVQAFPPTGARWQVSRSGGRQPQWAPDGRQIFYISRDKKLVAVDVDGSTSRFDVGASRVLVDTRVGGWERTHLGNPYAITADGQKILVANAADDTLSITVMLNWHRVGSGQQQR